MSEARSVIESEVGPGRPYPFEKTTVVADLRKQGEALADYTISELAELYGVPRSAMYNMLRNNDLPYKGVNLDAWRQGHADMLQALKADRKWRSWH